MQPAPALTREAGARPTAFVSGTLESSDAGESFDLRGGEKTNGYFSSQRSALVAQMFFALSIYPLIDPFASR